MKQKVSLLACSRNWSNPKYRHVDNDANNPDYPDRSIVVGPVVSENYAKYEASEISGGSNSARNDTCTNIISKRT